MHAVIAVCTMNARTTSRAGRERRKEGEMRGKRRKEGEGEKGVSAPMH